MSVKFICLIGILMLTSSLERCESQVFPIVGMVLSSFTTHEQPPFTSVANLTTSIEERKYLAKNWVCTAKTSPPAKIDGQIRDMFMSLFHYIQGQNEGSHQIEMTVPVAMKVVQKDTNENDYTMCFFIPEKFQANPPAPTAVNVQVVAFPELHIFSRRYSGYTTQVREHEYLSELQSTLANKGISYFEQDKGLNATHFVNGYDSPVKFWNRRNEVWLLAKE